jgi:probable nitrogen fixation protein
MKRLLPIAFAAIGLLAVPGIASANPATAEVLGLNGLVVKAPAGENGKHRIRVTYGLAGYTVFDGSGLVAGVGKDQRREIPVIGDPDEQTLSRVKAFYNAISTLIEKECGLMAVPMLNITHEGFGRAFITTGKLVVMDRVVRDVHRYGYESLSKMKDEADKLLSVALQIIGTHREVAEL